MKTRPPQTPRELIDRAKAQLAEGDYQTAAHIAVVAIADLLDQWLQYANTDEQAETPEIHWIDNPEDRL